ncbi:MAG: type II toxin-antitoxin system death-on-curing family toxin, partial [Xanthomonadales bacterium]|nr:type II toxin-antitoxin system death-on-curing family toxin [Xanthomonadales bacterium]
FLALNSVEIVASDEEKYVAMISLAEGSQSEAEFADWLRQRTKLDVEKQVNEPRTGYARR